MKHDRERGTLYVVATPIGNLGDMSSRAIQILSNVHVIAAEDTRHSTRLLNHFGLRKQLLALHDHNEMHQADQILALLAQGQDVALVSDAGTPLISDPGFRVVNLLREQGYRVSPIPGPCALIAALCAAGLPSDRFMFEGFLPARRSARLESLQTLRSEQRTVVFYESPHRLRETLVDMLEVYGAERVVVLAREITKTFETFFRGSMAEVQAFVEGDDNQSRGEFVLLVSGCPEAVGRNLRMAQVDLDSLIVALAAELPVKRVAALLSTVVGIGRNEVYRRALELRPGSPPIADEGQEYAE